MWDKICAAGQLSLEFDRDLQDVHNELDAKNVEVSLFPKICNYILLGFY